ncbi:DeoR/GlpR family DNA-binding transcription regulator [Dactylosporangium siamense]|uniref:Transcriptional regulator n=1 Tax=Dactylosporangium siamense TaxID=685454 RepID=A0A919UBL6_9ACTN|nr:DeoR/GlpR family DNA-binding transcription regulator [Dactylosporangium siamense]GIG49629.1 transcriptional regulator [Dactylosporangium siamense]
MNRYERWTRLLEMVAGSGQLTIEETAAELGVSPATVRRDFDELAAQQLVQRTRGGAAAHSVSYDLPLRFKVARHAPEKQRIATAAAGMISAGSTVCLNGGTTTTEVARALAMRADLNNDQRGPAVTVVTNALNIANELVVRPHVRVVATGGAARPQSYELIGPIAAAMLQTVAVDVAVLGVDAIDHQHGASAHNDGEAAINQIMADRANRVIIVADSSKLGQRAFARICTISAVDTLVTDSTATDEQMAVFTDAGVKVIRA